MRRLFFVIIGLVLALVLALVIAVLLGTRSQPAVLATVNWGLDTFTDLRLELRNPRLDVYAGTLSADEIHLLPASEQAPALVSLLQVSASFTAGELFGRRAAASSLDAGSLLIYVSDQEAEADPAPTQWLSYLGWLPNRLRLAQVHLITASANTWIFPVKDVRGDRLDSGSYRATASADYEGEPLDIALELFSLESKGDLSTASTSIEFKAPASGSAIAVNGDLEGSSEDFRYDFSVDAFYQDISEFLKGFEGGKRLAGTLRLNGKVKGDAGGFILSDARFLLDNMPEYGFEAGGQMTYRWSGESSIALVANGEMAALDYLVDWLDMDVTELGRAQSSLRLGGSLDKPVVESFRLTTGNDAGLAISLSGKLKLYEQDALLDAQENTVFIDMQGPSLAVLKEWLGGLPLEPGPWRASARASGDQQAVALTDIVLETGSEQTVLVRATGSVGNIAIPGAGQEGQIQASDIALLVNAHTSDSAQLGILLGRDDIPPYQEVSASAQLTGTQDELLIANGALKVTASDLVATADNASAVLRPGDELPLSALGANIKVELSDLAALSQYSPRKIPVLGPVRVSATLSQSGQLFQLLDIKGIVGTDELKLETSGQIGDLAALRKVSLHNKVQGTELATVLADFMPDFDYEGELGNLAGAFTLADKDGEWQVTGLKLAAGSDSTPLQLSLKGEISDLGGLPKANLVGQADFRDTALLQALTGLPLSPIEAKLQLSTSPYGVHGVINAEIGQTLLNVNTVVAFEGDSINSLQLILDTPHLYLQNLFNVQNSLVPVQPPAGQAPPKGPLEQLRESPPGFPIDVAVSIGGISGDNSHIDSLAVRVTGIDHRYTLENFSAVYDNALAEIRGLIDLKTMPAVFSLAGSATALPLSAILTDVGVNTNVSGALTVLGGITAIGDSPAQLVANLDGSIAVALENAVIEGAAYDLLATDLLAWIYSGALTETSTYLDCTMAKFQLRQGVATSDSLYIESAKMVATGKAEFDLVKQRMDLRITPLSKSRMLQVPSEVRLKGPMSDPQAIVSPISAVADATSAALMLIPNLTMKLFGIGQSTEKSYRPCQADLGN